MYYSSADYDTEYININTCCHKYGDTDGKGVMFHYLFTEVKQKE